MTYFLLYSNPKIIFSTPTLDFFNHQLKLLFFIPTPENTTFICEFSIISTPIPFFFNSNSNSNPKLLLFNPSPLKKCILPLIQMIFKSNFRIRSTTTPNYLNLKLCYAFKSETDFSYVNSCITTNNI